MVQDAPQPQWVDHLSRARKPALQGVQNDCTPMMMTGHDFLSLVVLRLMQTSAYNLCVYRYSPDSPDWQMRH